MTVATTGAARQPEFAVHRTRVAEIRERARALFSAGTPGIQIAGTTCEAVDQFLLSLWTIAQSGLADSVRAALADATAVIAVGGTGRGELCPYSDIDLLFLSDRGNHAFRDCTTRFVQSCWDAKLELGQSARTVSECVSLARQDSEVATSLIEARLLWGSIPLFERLKHRFRRGVVDGRRRAFFDECLLARRREYPDAERPALELEPNVKRSLGGLRDLHLIRWLGYAVFGSRDIDALRLKGALSMDEAHGIRAAWEFLTRVRIDLHLAAGKEQDQLNRDEQLRLAESGDFPGRPGQRPVERFMQVYFRHASTLATIAERFAARHRPRSLLAAAKTAVLSHRADAKYRISSDLLDVSTRHLDDIGTTLEDVLRLYRTAARNGVVPSQRMIDALRQRAPSLSDELSPAAGRLFLEILACTTHLGPVLRSMYDTGVLEKVIPDMRHVRCLMQFNQYHHYTVDEHSLRAVEAAIDLERLGGAPGEAYKQIKRKDLLHLALLLHDLGKGFDEDHCDVGRRIAARTADRLQLPPRYRERLLFLVHRHLQMSHLAFRRDITDPQVQLQFSHEVGTPESLQMLYVLTCADIRAVGPDAWTPWKEELLTNLFDASMLILSGKHDRYHEQIRLREIKDQVANIRPSGPTQQSVDRLLEGFSAYYLTCTPIERIAADLDLIERLGVDDVLVQGHAEGDATVEYQVVTRNAKAADGCFHKMAGVLTAQRMQILSADINTTRSGVVVDRFRVVDQDFAGQVPAERVDDVAAQLRRVLSEDVSVEGMFQRYRRFGAQAAPVSDLPVRIVLDNDSSDSRTVIDVFAHDRPGLLYSVARALHELELSVDLAKIATHYDQVVDVFYVRGSDGRKVPDDQLSRIRHALTERLEEFERSGHKVFAGDN